MAKRSIYVGKEIARSLYDEEYYNVGRLWKVTITDYHPQNVIGADCETIHGRFFAATWDLQNQRVSLGYQLPTKAGGTSCSTRKY